MPRPTTDAGLPGGRVAGAESGRRLLSVLLMFSESKPMWTIPELSEALGLGSSMVYRFVGLLREVGLLDVAPEHRYRVTDLAASLAAAAAAGRAPLADVARPVLERLRDEVDETVLVARRSGWRVYTVDRVESRRPVRLQFEPGQAMSLHVGSIPRVLLATMPPGERRTYLSHLPQDERDSPLLSDSALDQIAADGVTESFEEVDEGIWGVGALIQVDGVVQGAIGCAAPLFRTNDDKRRRVRELVVEAAAEIGAGLASASFTPGDR